MNTYEATTEKQVLEYIKNTSHHINYCEAIIDKSGGVVDAVPSHLYKMINISGKSMNTLRNMIPMEADPTEWLVDYLGCIAVWYSQASIPSSINSNQIRTLVSLQDSGRISPNFIMYQSNEYHRCNLIDKFRKSLIEAQEFEKESINLSRKVLKLCNGEISNLQKI